MGELSEFLKTERLNRGLSLDTVSGCSGISSSMLSYLEAGEFERFGAPVLVRNTIRAYCRVLEIDACTVIEKFACEIDSCDLQTRGFKKFGEQMKRLRKKRRMIGLPLFVLFLISAGIFWGGAWVSEKRSRMLDPPEAGRVLTQEDLPAELHEQPMASVPEKQSDVDEAALRKADEAIRKADLHIREWKTSVGLSDELAGPVEEEHLAETSERPTFSNSTAEAVADDRPVKDIGKNPRNRFALEANGNVWVQVKIDDKEIRSEMLHSGDRREWSADKSMQVVIGNAGGVRMKWNDQALKAPHEPGRVLRFRLPDYAKAE
jgi:cytoskeleton protein RodZ